jgi:hypothetical protein
LRQAQLTVSLIKKKQSISGEKKLLRITASILNEPCFEIISIQNVSLEEYYSQQKMFLDFIVTKREFCIED